MGGRVAQCGCTRHHSHVEIWRSKTGGGKAEFRGLTTCGSIWSCPVCAGKIAAKRAGEVASLVRAHEKAVYAAHESREACTFMATLTLKHHVRMGAKNTRDTVAVAWRNMQAGAPWVRLKGRYGIIGMVRALEVTHGGNGWHPHLHVLIMTDQPLTDGEREAMADEIYARWETKVEKLGHSCTRDGFDLRTCRGRTGAAEYVAKWGAGAEIAKGASKEAKSGSRSPWQFLRAYQRGNRKAGALFAEYAKAFKGARHLTYTSQIRERYGLRETADADLAAQSEIEVGETPELCIALSPGAWFEVCAREGQNGMTLQAEILYAAEIGGKDAVLAILIREGIDPDLPRSWKPPGTKGWRPYTVPKSQRDEAREAGFRKTYPQFWERFTATTTDHASTHWK
ncbi:MAG: protein rep [Pseudomonadota bacterium]